MIFLLFVFVLLYQPHQKQNGPQPKQKSQAVDHSVSYTPCGVQRVTQGFNLMHPMRGATTFSSRRQVPNLHFNLMHPVRGATVKSLYRASVLFLFQSNAPRAGCNDTICSGRALVHLIYFNLTHPVRGATAKLYNPSVS